MNKKNIQKQRTKKETRTKPDNLNVDEKEQLRKDEKNGKKAKRDNLDDELKEHLKIEDKKRNKAKCDNLNVDEKEQLRKYDKKGKKSRPDNLGDDEKEQVRKDDKKRKMNKRLQTLDERNSIFNNVQVCSMVDPSILTITAFRLTGEDFESAIQEGPTYICDIC